VTDTRRRLFLSLCSMVFLVNFARVVFASLLDPIAVDFRVDEAALGAVATAAWLGSALPRVPTGYLLTRVPRHHVVLGSGGLLVAAAVFTSFSPTLPLVTLGAFLLGLSSGAYFIAANPLVSELFPEGVGRALGIHGTASQLAAVAAPLVVVGVLFVGDWRLTFRLLAVVGVLATVAMYGAARRADLPDAGSEDRDLFGAARAQWRIVLTGVVVVGTVGFLWNGLFNFYVRYLSQVKGVTPGTGNLLLTLLFAAGVPAFFLTGRLADRFPNVPLLLGVVGGFLCCVLLLTLTQGLLPLVALTAVMGYVIHMLFPVADTYLLASLPDHHRASAYTAYSASAMIVQAGGSVVIGRLVAGGLPFDTVLRGLAGVVGVVLAALVALHVTGRLPAGRVPGEAEPSPAGETT
jgi:predicted MFS family arabinose efflux permease